MDPLSSIIALLRPRGTTVGATDVGGDLAIGFPAYEGAFFYSVAFGECWLQVQGHADPLLLRTGDCVVLTGGRAFTLASDLQLAPTPASAVFEGRANGSISTFQGGGRCMMFAAHFEFESESSGFLLRLLPAVVTINAPERKAALRAALDQMIEELKGAEPGCEAVVEHLAHIALVKVLRFHLVEAAGERPGWLFALADPKLSRALAAIHRDTAKPWTVAALSALCSMSRTSFATRFRARVGETPMNYLTSLRMLMAAKRLAEPGKRIAAVAEELGYESEAAFSTAFKRVMGLPPRRYAAGLTRPALGDHELDSSPAASGLPA